MHSAPAWRFGPFELDSGVAIDLGRHFLGEIDEYVWHPFEIAYRHRDVLWRSEVRRPGGAGGDAEPKSDERHSKTGHWNRSLVRNNASRR